MNANDLGREAFSNYDEDRQNGCCIYCHRNALEHCYSEAGSREVAISGICEECFDELFADEDEL